MLGFTDFLLELFSSSKSTIIVGLPLQKDGLLLEVTFTERWMRKIQVIQTETSTVQSKAI